MRLSLAGSPKVQVLGSSSFAVAAQPNSPVTASGGITTFQVVFHPQTSGTPTATVRITNNDSNEGTYEFGVQGSVLHVREVGHNGEGFRITFDSFLGRNYRVEFKKALTDQDWAPLADRPGTGEPIEVIDATEDGQRFYRVVLVP